MLRRVRQSIGGHGPRTRGRNSGKFVASPLFPSNLAAYDADYSNEQYFGCTLPNDNSNAQDGRFLREFVTNLVPNYAENADGSLKTFNNNNFVRRTTRGLVVDMDRTNVIIQNRDLTNAAWTKGGSPTVTKTGIDRTGAANSCSLVTLTGAQATFTQNITLASSSRIMSIECKIVNGTPTGRISFDGGTTYTAINFTTPMKAGQTATTGARLFCKTRTAAQTVTNPVVIIEINGQSGDQVAISFPECLNALAGDGLTLTEYAPISTTTAAVQGWRDRAAAYTTDTIPSNVALFNRDEPSVVYFFDFWTMRPAASGEVALIASDGSLQIRARSVSGDFATAFGNSSVAGPIVTTDYHNPIHNKLMCGANASESFLCLNGAPLVVGPPLTFNPAATHFDRGTNGAGALRLDGGIFREWGGRNYAAGKAAAQAFTT